MAKHNKCIYCNQDIVLVPSANERAKNCRQGLSAQDYKNMFTSHSDSQQATWYDRPNPRTGQSAKQYTTKPFMSI